MLFKRKLETPDPPPIFADLVLENRGGRLLLNVEEPGWQNEFTTLMQHYERVGLLMRGEREPRLWVTPNGTPPRYFSRVLGTINDAQHRQVRVACLQSGSASIWLHRDGVVEVQPEPSFRECE